MEDILENNFELWFTQTEPEDKNAPRAGEVKKFWVRAERFYHTEEGWWFETREGKNFGPFKNRAVAERELIYYLHSK